MSGMHPQWFMFNYIDIYCRQNSSKKNCKIIKDKAIEELIIKQFAKSKLKKYHEHQLMVSQQKKREKKKKYYQEEITETENEAQQKKKIEFKSNEIWEAQFCQIIARLEVKIIAHDHDYFTAVSVLRERVKKKIRRFLSQLQSLSEDNNSLSASEKMEKDDFEIVVFSDKNDEKDNEVEDN
ncbi:uncharacterized protein CIMG_12575 [Coccidioides immitis RS]|uniref:Uncharacterized protein n=1 Tax=Coccidioides immitis (strain RS) TaxID=246410 RepID=J3K049_COCIM|nr:uncharacterized protein CIMG_12575 [Coccidioides immitis RS]EAS27189.3 hypothetical protein CIMG_12575 [Coccidioides immitis RS]